MPDRAVVELSPSEAERNMILDFLHRSLARIDRDLQDAGRQDNVAGSLRLFGERRACELLMSSLLDKPTPRALVAISEDRQWLVVQRDHPVEGEVFQLFKWDDVYAGWYPADNNVCRITWEDTGQSAEDVLAAWLEGIG